MQYDVSYDGIRFINAYSKAFTPLGRVLSNFYYYPFECEKGSFYCIEGLWHFLKYEGYSEAESFHRLTGAAAKALAEELVVKYGRGNEITRFDLIYNATWDKVKHFKKLFLQKYRELPIVHFYVYGGVGVPVPGAQDWVVELNKMKECVYAGTEYLLPEAENLK